MFRHHFRRFAPETLKLNISSLVQNPPIEALSKRIQKLDCSSAGTFKKQGLGLVHPNNEESI